MGSSRSLEVSASDGRLLDGAPGQETPRAFSPGLA